MNSHVPSFGVKKLDIRGKVSGIKNAFSLFCYLYSYLLFLTSTLIPTHELPLLFLLWYSKSDYKLLFLKPASWGEEKLFCLLSSLWTEKFKVLHHQPSLVTYSCWTLACRQRTLLWLDICFSDFQNALLIQIAVNVYEFRNGLTIWQNLLELSWVWEW